MLSFWLCEERTDLLPHIRGQVSYARKRFMWRWRICAHGWSLGAKWRTWSWEDVNPSCTPGRRRVLWTSVGLWDLSQRKIKQMFTAAAQMCSFIWPPQVCWAWPCFVWCSDWLTASWFKPASSRMSTGSLWRSPIGWFTNILFGRHPSQRAQWISALLFIHLLLFNIFKQLCCVQSHLNHFPSPMWCSDWNSAGVLIMSPSLIAVELLACDWLIKYFSQSHQLKSCQWLHIWLDCWALLFCAFLNFLIVAPDTVPRVKH